MGLDVVELVMDVEEEFGIRIADRDAAAIRNVGDLIDHVYAQVRSLQAAICPTSHFFYRFRHEIMTVLPWSRHAIRPAMPLAEVVPGSKRRRLWRHLRHAGLRLPNLRLFPPLSYLAGGLLLASSLSLASVFIILFFAPTLFVTMWSRNWLAVWATIPVGLGFWLATRPLAVRVPAELGTVRNAVLYLAPTHPPRTPVAKLTRDSISEGVRRIISKNLRVPFKQVNEESRFVEDLGCD